MRNFYFEFFFSLTKNSIIKVQHPAAKLLIMASDMQEKEVGDGTNFVLIFGAQLLQNAADLLNMVIRSTTENNYMTWRL